MLSVYRFRWVLVSELEKFRCHIEVDESILRVYDHHDHLIVSAEVTIGRGAVRSRVCDELLPAANAHQSKLIGATYQCVPFIGLSASDRRSAGP